jgi:hypothetical protein
MAKSMSESRKDRQMDDMPGFRMQLFLTAGLADLKIFPDDKCCRILAWLYVYGGENEQVLDNRLSDAVFYAQGRLNLLGGETPEIKLVSLLQGYVKSVEDYNNPPEWVISLEKEYGIKPHRGKEK